MSSRPLYALLTVILPLVAFGILWATFSKGVPRDLPIVVCDMDHSALSRKIIRMIDASATIKVAHQVDDMESGYRLVQNGSAYSLIVLPKDLQADALELKSPSIIHYYNNELLLPGSLIVKGIRNTVGALSENLDLRSLPKRNQSSFITPGIIDPVRLETHTLFNPYLNYTYYLVSTLLPNMLQIFVVVMTVFAFGIELKDGTAAEWLECAGGHPWKAILGKWLPYTLVFSVVGIFMNSLLFKYIDVPIRGNPWMIMAATVLLILAYQAVGLFLISFVANLRLALSFSAFYASTAFAFIGVTYPTIGMPLAAKAWAGILPLSYYIKFFIDQSIRGIPIEFSIYPIMALMVFILFLPIISIFRMGRIMNNKKYWGRM